MIELLASLGFTNATEVGRSKSGVVTMRIRTSKGWAYDKFATEDDVRAWAYGKTPE